MTIDKPEPLNPEKLEERTKKEAEIIADAQHAGKGLEFEDPNIGDPNVLPLHNTGGPLEQTVNSKAVADFGKRGGESDISGGLPDRDGTVPAEANENPYNS